MQEQPLGERRKALEEEFFRKHNAEVLARLRASQAREDERQLMASASGIQDTEVIDRLIDEGLSPATVAALALAPLVVVAWADRKLDTKERQAVLDEAAASGVTPGSPAHELLQGWLQEEPAGSLMATWRDYARAISGSLTPDQRRDFRETLLRRAKAVANAAGGFAGLGSRLSAVESETLHAIEAALPD